MSSSLEHQSNILAASNCSFESDNWDDDFSFSGDLLIPQSVVNIHEKLQSNLDKVKTFSNSSKQLETLLLSIPENQVTNSIFENNCISQSLDVVALSHDDPNASFFQTKIGSEYLRRTQGKKLSLSLLDDENISLHDKQESDCYSDSHEDDFDFDLPDVESNDKINNITINQQTPSHILDINEEILNKLSQKSESLLPELQTNISEFLTD